MVVNCEVKFDNNPNGIFFAGQTLSGVVELTIDKPKKIRGLILKIEGYAKVEWTEYHKGRYGHQRHGMHHHHGGHGHHGIHGSHGIHGHHGMHNHHGIHTSNFQNSRTVHYSGREDYISNTSYLMGSQTGQEIEMAPGQYRYNFQTVLPAQLPSSCEATNGSIRYLVNVILDRPFKFDLTYKCAFNVIKQLDLNYEVALNIPVKMETSKTFCCWICETKPLFMSASIPFSGYVSGQTIVVTAEINNESRVDIEMVKISLKKIIRYTAQVPSNGTKVEVSKVAEFRCGGVKRTKREAFIQPLLIPPIPPTNINYCRLLNISYEVQVKCSVPKYTVEPVIRLPITIGTVPLNVSQYQEFQPSAPMTTPQTLNLNYDTLIGGYDNGVSGNSMGNGAPPPYMLPSYAETNESAIEISEAGEHTMGSKPFHPMHIVYGFRDFQQQPSTMASNQANVPQEQVDTSTIQRF